MGEGAGASSGWVAEATTRRLLGAEVGRRHARRVWLRRARVPPGFSPATEWPKWIAYFLSESYGSGKESAMSHQANLRQGGFSQSRRRQRIFPILLLVVLCCLGSTEIVSAGVNAWTSIGPEGVLVTSLAIDPTAPLI